MNFTSLFAWSGVLVIVSMLFLWLLSVRLKNASIVDIFWGFDFVLIAWTAFFLAPQGYIPRKELSVWMATLWGLRLTFHIGWRNWGKREDFRYAAWREQNGQRWWWISFFKVFLLQGILMWVISAPLIAVQTSGFPAILTPLDLTGGMIWGFGLAFETIGDRQLTRFKSNPANKGKLLISGLWKFTRHPNYFGDAVAWWGMYLVALASGSWWTIFSPILMTWLLMKVSGVAMLERTMSAKPGYEEYMQKTSAFFPWFPKS